MDENIELNQGCDHMPFSAKFNNDINANSLNDITKISERLGHAIDFERRMRERESNPYDTLTYLMVHMSNQAWEPLFYILHHLNTPFDRKRLPLPQEDVVDSSVDETQVNINTADRVFLDSIRSFTEAIEREYMGKHEAAPTAISSAISENVENNSSVKHQIENQRIFRVHSEGHLVVISEYSKDTEDVVKYRASTKLLSEIICQKKQPVIIDIERLSNLQLAGIRKALNTIDSQITVKQVNKKGKRAWVIKPKR